MPSTTINGLTVEITCNMKEKPPLGVKPKELHDARRANDLECAINRYLNSSFEIPIEWINELNELRKNGVKAQHVDPYGDFVVFKEGHKEPILCMFRRIKNGFLYFATSDAFYRYACHTYRKDEFDELGNLFLGDSSNWFEILVTRGTDLNMEDEWVPCHAISHIRVREKEKDNAP